MFVRDIMTSWSGVGKQLGIVDWWNTGKKKLQNNIHILQNHLWQPGDVFVSRSKDLQILESMWGVVLEEYNIWKSKLISTTSKNVANLISRS